MPGEAEIRDVNKGRGWFDTVAAVGGQEGAGGGTTALPINTRCQVRFRATQEGNAPKEFPNGTHRNDLSVAAHLRNIP